MKLELRHPIEPFIINQRFGECAPSVCAKYRALGLDGHNGMDVWADDGTIVRAAHDGIVTFAGEDGSAGLGVVIRTHDQFDYKGGEAFFKSIYWHLKKGGIRVLAGQHVKAGDIIALADNTGMSTGSHLHFGLKPVYQGEQDWGWWNAEQNNGYKGAIDPEPYLTKRYIFVNNMAFGSSGEHVRQLQLRLGVTPVTGLFWVKTLSAVRAFQKEHSITATGFVGPLTLTALNNT